ncbi:carboxymuconolactone decarboxylase family protein [Sphingobium sp. MK2]|uniref:carboxymuconolactone decarboxylase family protein n=1 Tax=Sphingobium sp. MK2 TaxID=3116540 RepID=UPI0032E35BDE
MTPAQAAVHDRIVSGPRGRLAGPLRAALLNPELADRWQSLGALLRYSTSLPPKLSELAILVTAQSCRSSLEWIAHAIEGRKAGLADEMIDMLERGEPIAGDSDEAVVCAFARELNQLNSVTDATYDSARKRLGDVGVVELTALVGYYTMVAMTLNTHEIPLPPDMADVRKPFAYPHDPLGQIYA